jgi:beta-aspartyl-peptidase (threonine type)
MVERAWAVVLHGGCKPIDASEAAANRRGCERALSQAVDVLAGGGTAIEAVEAAVRVLESDPTFNAGKGSVRNADGEVEADAALMDGETLALGAVAAAPRLLHPISVARAMLEEDVTLLAGEAALRFAEARGVAQKASGDRPAGEGRGRDTVGCVALDTGGRIAAGTSTGGLDGAPPGRVGDSPLPGCGVYADSDVGGISASGVGESISRTILAARALFAMEQGDTPQTAVEAALERLDKVGGDAGLIAVDRKGRIGIDHRGTQFAVAWAASDDPGPHVELRALDEEPEHG